MATTTYHQDHSYPPPPSTSSHDITRSETPASAFVKHRYLPDDDGDDDTLEAQPLPKDGSPQWDQPPPQPEPQRPARKWWQRVRVHILFLFPVEC